ncbi:MAG: stage IV sporulation protein A [Clostridia bacterium]|nr:stage IV sporulation protein A [Clostridia bacterium]
MEEYNIYNDIGERCGGDIYIGVVGPVRTGKSTFIKKFMELLVLPNITQEHSRLRAQDELPQSAAGRTIMTTEPKFIPNEAVEISLADNAKMNVRMIDCVGYIVDGAMGDTEDGQVRMVQTPWSVAEMPFPKAAEIGTQKVIREHSTIGLVITTDGTVTDIEREGYIEAEERVIRELREINKPFIVLLNSTNPYGEKCSALKEELQAKYGVSVMSVDCANLGANDINAIIESVLFEFPVSEISIDIPKWVTALDDENCIKKGLYEKIRDSLGSVNKIKDISDFAGSIGGFEYAQRAATDSINLGNGTVKMSITAPAGLFYKVLSDETGFDISDEGNLMSLMKELSTAKKNYDKLEYALHEVTETGYGIVSPSIDELRLEEPEIVKQGGKYGVRLRASAPSIHMIRADIETEVSPIVGTEKQSEELIHYLLSEFEVDPKKIWESNLFGKSLHELVNEGLHNKLSLMPKDAQNKLRDTLEKIINEGSGGLICIIL